MILCFSFGSTRILSVNGAKTLLIRKSKDRVLGGIEVQSTQDNMGATSEDIINKTNEEVRWKNVHEQVLWLDIFIQ